MIADVRKMSYEPLFPQQSCSAASKPQYRPETATRLGQDFHISEARFRMIRLAKLLLVTGVALLISLVVLNNLTDFGTNYEFVRHVLRMDTLVPGGHVLGRAIPAPWIHLVFYVCIIAWEAVTAILLWWGAASMLRSWRLSATEFNAAKMVSVLGLSLSLLLWLVAFLAIGGEWFLMWESPAWNGQQAAFRNFTVVGIVLLILLQRDD
jgi:predicted small integral membrane protein